MSERVPNTAGSRSRVKAPAATRTGESARSLNWTEDPAGEGSVERRRVRAGGARQGSVRMPQTRAEEFRRLGGGDDCECGVRAGEAVFRWDGVASGGAGACDSDGDAEVG